MSHGDPAVWRVSSKPCALPLTRSIGGYLCLRLQLLSLIGHLSDPETQTQDSGPMNVREALSNVAPMGLESGCRQRESVGVVGLEPPGLTSVPSSVCILNASDDILTY